MNFYEVLDVAEEASSEEVRAAYLRLVQEHHPDRHVGGATVELRERFKQIQEAYEVLHDPAQRRAYDNQRSIPKPRRGNAQPSGPTRANATVRPINPAVRRDIPDEWLRRGALPRRRFSVFAATFVVMLFAAAAVVVPWCGRYWEQREVIFPGPLEAGEAVSRSSIEPVMVASDAIGSMPTPDSKVSQRLDDLREANGATRDELTLFPIPVETDGELSQEVKSDTPDREGLELDLPLPEQNEIALVEYEQEDWFGMGVPAFDPDVSNRPVPELPEPEFQPSPRSPATTPKGIGFELWEQDRGGFEVGGVVRSPHEMFDQKALGGQSPSAPGVDRSNWLLADRQEQWSPPGNAIRSAPILQPQHWLDGQQVVPMTMAIPGTEKQVMGMTQAGPMQGMDQPAMGGVPRSYGGIPGTEQTSSTMALPGSAGTGLAGTAIQNGSATPTYFQSPSGYVPPPAVPVPNIPTGFSSPFDGLNSRHSP